MHHRFKCVNIYARISIAIYNDLAWVDNFAPLPVFARVVRVYVCADEKALNNRRRSLKKWHILRIFTVFV